MIYEVQGSKVQGSKFYIDGGVNLKKPSFARLTNII